MGPVIAYVGKLIQPLGEIVFVVARSVQVVIVCVVVSEDIISALVASVVGVLYGLSVLLRVDHRDLEVLNHVDNYISVAKEFPGDQAALRGSLYFKVVIYYEGIVIRHSQRDVEILS